MSKEIERKWLLQEERIYYATDVFERLYPRIDPLHQEVAHQGSRILQGYLPLTSGRELADLLELDVNFTPVEARLREKGDKYWFTLKSAGGLLRDELKPQITEEIFIQFWERTKGARIAKFRHSLPARGELLEVDAYTDRDLVVAEVEFKTVADAERFPSLGKEVTLDPRYKNRNLAR